MSRFWVLLIFVISFASVAQENRRDPTRPPNVKSVNEEDPNTVEETIDGQRVSFPKIALSAIFHSQAKKYAVINDTIVNEGGSIENVVLTKVLPDRVILKLNDLQKELKINDTEVIKVKSYDY